MTSTLDKALKDVAALPIAAAKQHTPEPETTITLSGSDFNEVMSSLASHSGVYAEAGNLSAHIAACALYNRLAGSVVLRPYGDAEFAQATLDGELRDSAPETARERDKLKALLNRSVFSIGVWQKDATRAEERAEKAERQCGELLAALKWALPHVLKREGWIKPSGGNDMAGSIPKEIRDDMAAKYAVFKDGLDAMKSAIANAGTR